MFRPPSSPPPVKSDYYHARQKKHVSLGREATFITVDDERYTIKVIDPNLNFAKLKKNESVINLGLSSKQESLWLDQPSISKHYDEIKLPKDKPLSTILRAVIKYSYKKMKFSQDDVYAMFQKNKESPLYGSLVCDNRVNNPIMPLSLFIDKNVGVCRHYTMLNAYLLGQYASENKINANVNMFSLITKEGNGHVVTIWQDQENSFFIDTRRVYNLNNYEDYCRLMKLYKTEEIIALYSQYNISIPKQKIQEPIVLSSPPLESKMNKTVTFHYKTSVPAPIEPPASSPIPPPPTEFSLKVNTQSRSVTFYRTTPLNTPLPPLPLVTTKP